MMIQSLMDTVQASSSLGQQIFTIISSILIAFAGAALWIRKKLSADSLEIKKDQAEEDLIEHLEKERDTLKADKEKLLERLIAVDKDRQEAVGRIGKLSADVEHLTNQVVHLEKMVELLGKKLDSATDSMQKYAIENAKLSERLASFAGYKEATAQHKVYIP
jgi:uncharacterized protein YoxC